jgi:dihydroflavonol-4-reductase
MAAVMEGHKDVHRQFDEKDWTRLDRNLRAYAVSKTLAEQAAWDFIRNQGASHSMEMAVINPANVLGPILDPRQTSSTELIISLMRHVYPGCARLHTILVDVRDVAAAHLLAMTSPAAAGERFLCYSSILWLTEIAHILNEHFSARGYRVPERILPDALVRINALFDPLTRDFLPYLGVEWKISNQKLLGVLGWQPRSMESSIVDTGESLIHFGRV